MQLMVHLYQYLLMTTVIHLMVGMKMTHFQVMQYRQRQHGSNVRDLVLYAKWEANSGGSGTSTDPYIVEDNTYDPTAIPQDDGYYNYTNVEGSPVVNVVDGEIVSYELTDTGNDGITTPSGGIDTGVIAFDGTSSFSIHIEFYATFSSEVSYDKVVSVIQDTGTSSSHKYSGFNLFYYYKSSGGGGGSSSAKYLRTQSFSNKSALTGQTMSSGNNLKKVDTTITSYYNTKTKYTFDITYTNGSGLVSVTSKINDGNTNTQTFTSDVSELSNATVTIGGNGLDNSQDVESMEVLAFSVQKQ